MANYIMGNLLSCIRGEEPDQPIAKVSINCACCDSNVADEVDGDEEESDILRRKASC